MQTSKLWISILVVRVNATQQDVHPEIGDQNTEERQNTIDMQTFDRMVRILGLKDRCKPPLHTHL